MNHINGTKSNLNLYINWPFVQSENTASQHQRLQIGTTITSKGFTLSAALTASLVSRLQQVVWSCWDTASVPRPLDVLQGDLININMEKDNLGLLLANTPLHYQ